MWLIQIGFKEPSPPVLEIAKEMVIIGRVQVPRPNHFGAIDVSLVIDSGPGE